MVENLSKEEAKEQFMELVAMTPAIMEMFSKDFKKRYGRELPPVLLTALKQYYQVAEARMNILKTIDHLSFQEFLELSEIVNQVPINGEMKKTLEKMFFASRF